MIQRNVELAVPAKRRGATTGAYREVRSPDQRSIGENRDRARVIARQLFGKLVDLGVVQKMPRLIQARAVDGTRRAPYKRFGEGKSGCLGR